MWVGGPNGSALHLRDHVVHDLGVLDLRAEEDDLGVVGDPDRVAGRPVEQVAGVDRLLASVGEADDERAGQR